MEYLRNTFVLFALVRTLAVAQSIIVADIWKPASTAEPSTAITERQSALSVPLVQAGDQSLYWINITVGTPGQPQSLQLDTGSRRIWVPATGSSVCSNSVVDCAQLGSFDSSESSTFQSTGQTDSITYADGSGVSGPTFYDTFRIGGQAVTKQIALLAKQGSGLSEGVLGVGFPASAPTINHDLADQGAINGNKYSVWLNSLDASSGTIIFGGVDVSKYNPPLRRLPVLDTDQPTVELTRIATLQGIVPTVQTDSGFSMSVVLDTGTTLTFLPTALVSKINDAVGAQYYPGATNGVTIIPCSKNNDSLSINFHFGSQLLGPTINVEISQLVLGGLGTLNGVQMCQFGLYASDGSYPNTLGTTFLRSAYVLFDLDRQRIGLAQARVASSDDARVLVEV